MHQIRSAGRRALAAGLLATACAPLEAEHQPAFHPSPLDVLREHLRTAIGLAPRGLPAAALGRAEALEGWSRGGDAVMWLGHAGVMLRLAGHVAVVDPVFGEWASPIPGLGPRRMFNPPFDAESLPRLDLLLLTHDHYDHLERASFLALAARDGATCLLPRGVAGIRAIACARTEELGWGEAREAGPLRATFLPARHHSGRGLLDHRATLWGAWCLEGEGRRVYLGGDSAYGTHFTEAAERFGGFDLAILGIGGYLPRDPNSHHHSSPEEVVRAFVDLRARRLMLVHWGSYPMGAEDTGEAPWTTVAAARAAGVPREAVLVPRIGETIAL